MTRSEDIHRSITEADDLEDIHEPEIPVQEVLFSLLRHPFQIVSRWNWKAALIGAALRASFYFTVYKAAKENFSAAITAAMVELAFRFFTSGISGSIVQSFRRASPAWLATLIVTILLPLFSHSVEYVTHYIQETYFIDILPASENNARNYAFALSVLFSAFSAMFNLFVMRHGVLLVGAGQETRSLWSDMRKIPALIFEFVTYLPLLTIDLFSRGKIVKAIGVPILFALSIGSILGIFRWKWSWGWTSTVIAFAVMIVWTAIVAVGSHFLGKKKEAYSDEPKDI